MLQVAAQSDIGAGASAVLVQIVIQLGTLATLIITGFFAARKLDNVKDLVNGHSTEQAAKIEKLHGTIESLSAALAGRRADDAKPPANAQ